MESNNKVPKLQGKIYEITNKNLLMEPVVRLLFSLTYLTKSPENPLHEHLASVCRAINSMPSEINQRNIMASNTMVFDVPEGNPLDPFKNALLSACNMTGLPRHCFRLRKSVLSRSSSAMFQLPSPAAAK